MITRANFGNILLNISIILMGVLLGANTYNLVVDAPNWGANIPSSLQHTRDYWQAANPLRFFGILSPIHYVVLLMALVVGWNKPRSRKAWIIVALICSVVVTILSFVYFFPRNDILFFNPLDPSNAEFLRTKLSEWVTMHWVRIAVQLLALISALRALNNPLEAEPEGSK